MKLINKTCLLHDLFDMTKNLSFGKQNLILKETSRHLGLKMYYHAADTNNYEFYRMRHGIVVGKPIYSITR
jgi:HD superfamily phosphodiesterase